MSNLLNILKDVADENGWDSTRFTVEVCKVLAWDKALEERRRGIVSAVRYLRETLATTAWTLSLKESKDICDEWLRVRHDGTFVYPDPLTTACAEHECDDGSKYPEW